MQNLDDSNLDRLSPIKERVDMLDDSVFEAPDLDLQRDLDFVKFKREQRQYIERKLQL